MALRKPAVMISGKLGNLPSGDTLDVTSMGGGDALIQTNAEASPIVIGAPVYNDVADSVKKAKADASGTTDVIGLVGATTITNGVTGVIQVNGILTATTTQWDAVAGTTGGLTVKTRYYLSAGTAGLLTATAPTTAGQYVVEVGIANSTTELKIDVKTPYLL